MILARGISVDQARRALGTAFGAAGLDTPDLDARILIAHTLDCDHTGLVAAGARALGEIEAAKISSLADRRLAGEPVARIIGQREFWSLPLIVTPDVLVPRPETETVVELALSLIEDRARPLRLADLGTGSGAILLALLHELPNAFGIGTDIAPAALDVARRNAMRHGLADRARFVACDYGAALSGPFDLVLSNPPYIATSVIATLAPEVRDHDPHRALDGGGDGLAAYRAIAADAARLAGTGHLLVEIGAGQARDVEFLLTQNCLAPAGLRHDLSGIARALSARPA